MGLYMVLDKTPQIYEFILRQYTYLTDDGILVMDYTGYARNLKMYKLLEWYISYSHNNSKINFSEEYFNYKLLIQLLKGSEIDFVDEHIDTKTINEQMNGCNINSFQRPNSIQTVSKLFVAPKIDKEKIKVRKLL